MMGVELIAAISAVSTQGVTPQAVTPQTITQDTPQAGAPGFAELMQTGLANLEAKVDTADDLVRAFALGEDVPIHEVTIALEEARLSVELALQVRNRMVEAYRDIMNTQL